MNRIGKIIVQDKRYELVWNGGVSVERTHGNTIRIQTDIDVWLNNKKEAPKEYVMDVIGRAVKEFLYQDITPFALAGSSRKYKTKTFLVDIDNEKIVSPDKGLNDPTIIGDIICTRKTRSDCSNDCRKCKEPKKSLKMFARKIWKRN